MKALSIRQPWAWLIVRPANHHMSTRTRPRRSMITLVHP